MPVVSAVASGESYDLILVGTGFASTFFLHRYLQQASAATRVLVLERGALHEHRWQVQHAAELERESAQSFQNRTPKKPWIFRVAVGGSSNCWWACTPRMLPEDFELATRYGIGRDWPVTYDQLAMERPRRSCRSRGRVMVRRRHGAARFRCRPIDSRTRIGS